MKNKFIRAIEAVQARLPAGSERWGRANSWAALSGQGQQPGLLVEATCTGLASNRVSPGGTVEAMEGLPRFIGYGRYEPTGMYSRRVLNRRALHRSVSPGRTCKLRKQKQAHSKGHSARSVCTPSAVASNRTSAGRRAKMPLVTTPVMLLIFCSVASGCGIGKL